MHTRQFEYSVFENHKAADKAVRALGNTHTWTWSKHIGGSGYIFNGLGIHVI
jgi:hypothetical protein